MDDQRLRALIEGAWEGVALIDREGRFLYLSARGAYLFAHTPEELVGTSAFDVIHPDDLAPARRELAELVATSGGEKLATFRYRRFDGEWRWLEFRARNSLDDPDLGAIILNFRDVTEAHRAERALRASEERFRRVADSAPVMMWTSHEGIACDWFNRAWLAFRGRKMEEELGFGWTEGVHPDDLDRVLSEYRSAAAEGRAFTINYRLRRADGAYRSILETCVPLPPEEGSAYIASATDVTELRAAHEARERLVADETRWLEAVLDALPVPIALADTETLEITFANRAADELAGGRFPRASGAELYEVFYSCTTPLGVPLSPIDLVGGAARGNPSTKVEMIWNSPAGKRTMLLSTHLLPALFGRRPTILCSFPDIAQQKATEAALERALEGRDAFLAAASHELRNPINALHLTLQVLRRTLERGGRGEEIHRAIEQTARIGRLLDNLLDLSQLTRGEPHLEIAELDLGEIVADTVERYRADPACGEIRLRAETGLRVQSDALRLEQCLGNLLSNAVKYGRSAPIDVVVAHDGDSASITVRDGGIGIDEATRPIVFERFRRGVPDRKLGGFGLGLWITREIVTALGGTIDFESEPGVGSTFRIRLPLPVLQPLRSSA